MSQPTSCASRPYKAVEYLCSLRMPQEVEKLGQLPAACQVEPAVSSSRSSSTTSVQPSRARWYSALQPTAPPPMTTTRAWFFMEHRVARSEERRVGKEGRYRRS